MKYLSIDIETAGLVAGTNEMIEFGAVIEDLASPLIPVVDLPSFRAIVVAREGEYRISPFVIRMHAALFKTIESADHTRLNDAGVYMSEAYTKRHEVWFCYPEQLERLFNQWLARHNVEGKITPAGKNFYGFDYGWIKPAMPNIRFHHRCLDPLMYFIHPEDQKPPNLELCCERAGISMLGYHTAVGDARMVIELIRVGMKRCGLS